MEEDDHRQLIGGRRTGRPVEADRDVAARTRDAQVPHVGHIGARSIRHHRDDEVAGVLDGEVRQLGDAELLQQVEDLLRLWVDGHGTHSFVGPPPAVDERLGP